MGKQIQRYFPDSDVLDIYLSRKDVADTIAAGPCVFVKIDKEGLPVQISILYASHLMQFQDDRPVIEIKGPPTEREIPRIID